MKTINRQIDRLAKDYTATFRSVCVVGPRQSGKTTLCKMLYPQKDYVNFEDPDTEKAYLEDSKKFLAQYQAGAIFDEAQRAPGLFRRLQVVLDQTNERALYIITGSSNFLLLEGTSQSLAGRIGYMELLPLSYHELSNGGFKYNHVNDYILRGGYPEVWQNDLATTLWMGSYVRTYLQRDVRMIRNITNLGLFNRFLYMCAGHAGQMINRDLFAKKLGIDNKTVAAWLSVLETSYIIFQLQPYHNNFNKRIVKSPKLYFYDTGLLCFLLSIKDRKGLENNSLYGGIFENWIISEIRKNRANQGNHDGMYYFRDSAGNEIDLLLESQDGLRAIEVKSSEKFKSDHFSGLRYWKKHTFNGNGLLVYGGKTSNDYEYPVLGWNEVGGIS